MDTNRLLVRGWQFHLSISPQTFPPLCSPAKTRGEKPQLLRATTGNNSRKFSTQNQSLEICSSALTTVHSGSKGAEELCFEAGTWHRLNYSSAVIVMETWNNFLLPGLVVQEHTWLCVWI